MKQALIVDPRGTVEEFAHSALVAFEQTTVSSWQEALALASIADYDLVLLAQPANPCDSATWSLVEQVVQAAGDTTLVMIQTEDASAEFQSRASDLGVTVVSTPLGVRALSMINEATAG